MSEDEAALLRMILDNPDDDLPRLVYADWLEERDRDERAWFIRSQCENQSWYRKNEFYKDEMIVGWHRGFIDEVGCTMAEWLKHGPATCAEHPVRKVMISDKEPGAPYTPPLPYYWGKEDAYNQHAADQSMYLPPMLFPSDCEDWSVDFKTETEANEWLSDRCIEWAKSQTLTHA